MDDRIQVTVWRETKNMSFIAFSGDAIMPKIFNLIHYTHYHYIPFESDRVMQTPTVSESKFLSFLGYIFILLTYDQHTHAIVLILNITESCYSKLTNAVKSLI